MKKTKAIAGLCLIGQSILFMVLSLIYRDRSKSLSGSLAFLSACSGIGGTCVMWSLLQEKQSKIDEELEDELDDGLFDDEEDFDDEISCSFGE